MKHITYDERLQIQECLKQGMNYTQIAETIGRDRATISREIKNRRTVQKADKGNFCLHRASCHFPQDCKTSNCTTARTCRTSCGLCRKTCDRFQEEHCPKLKRPPYVCNPCGKSRCALAKNFYSAKDAQKQYEQLLRAAREGIALSQEDFQFLSQKVIPLIKQGLSVPIVCDSLEDQMPISVKTLYTYIDLRLFELDNLDLRQKLRRPLRKKSGPILKVDKQCYQGRTYAHFQEFMEEHPDVPICQMDSVEGKKGGKVLLTLLFTNCNLQLLYLRERNTAASVTEIFQQLRKILQDDFPRLFPVILTDRGSEFTNPQAIEYDVHTKERQCRVFYCDPMNSNQKSQCERNHGLIRYILPKGKALDRYDQEDISQVMNHLNSYPRKKWNGLSPIELFDQIYSPSIRKKLGIRLLPPEALCLKPDLLKK